MTSIAVSLVPDVCHKAKQFKDQHGHIIDHTFHFKYMLWLMVGPSLHFKYHTAREQAMCLPVKRRPQPPGWHKLCKLREWNHSRNATWRLSPRSSMADWNVAMANGPRIVDTQRDTRLETHGPSRRFRCQAKPEPVVIPGRGTRRRQVESLCWRGFAGKAATGAKAQA